MSVVCVRGVSREDMSLEGGLDARISLMSLVGGRVVRRSLMSVEGGREASKSRKSPDGGRDVRSSLISDGGLRWRSRISLEVGVEVGGRGGQGMEAGILRSTVDGGT